ncbi:replication factor a 1, rfa1, putative [Perkinsus marinus ATCC 50983]|uniref:Replication factor a 1, rfa1, putative n=1 Tax=Perkinsus marinus (strain ATCC 50983 / TXsc) TaxID=423536 RepID=C5KIU9_PERM5|nr:replication factor a 1, rfa1, putative [Perkinsus marinus ATCC 50983]EER15585.1 replication factor a 1, rfa1, putative [Perkinsus marinus ATCC 50983]|eukprot:XP_002783789.1 replication factor a 1, rfa1, putative [Perkinsus marinus ATCC 50983]
MTTYFPIREISSYSMRNWTIKARVTAKSPVRHFTNARGGGSVFSVDLLDKEGSEIRGSFFNAAAEKFDKLLQKGKVYTFSKGNVKIGKEDDELHRAKIHQSMVGETITMESAVASGA